jgi:aspartate aminotransferase
MDSDSPGIHLNLNVRGMKPSATVAINERSDALRRQGRHIYKLGLGQSPFPVPDVVVGALREAAGEKDYLPVRGLHELREAVAGHHQRTYGIDTRPDQVIIGPGSKELMFLLQLCYYGDLVIPAPSWVSYAPQARILGRQVRFLPTRLQDRWKLLPEQLDAFCRTDPERPRLLILNYPSNPTGVTYTRDELAAIAEVARKHKVLVLSDEIYGKLHHTGEHRSMVPLYPRGTIFSGGLSKWCGAGGWRVGVFVIPDALSWLGDALAAVASETFTSTSAPIQHAAAVAFRPSAEIDAYLDQSRRILRALGRQLTATLRAGGVQLADPDGGFYLFPSFAPMAERLAERGLGTSAQICEQLLEDTGVAILPGSDFGRAEGEPTARLAYVNFDGERALQQAAAVPDGELDEAWLRAHCGETLTAVERLVDWLHA